MIETVLISLMVISGILILLGIGMGLYEWVHAKHNSPLNHLTIPKTMYVRLVVEWCHENIGGTNKKPLSKVKYHRSKTNGVYQPRNKEMVINVNTHSTILELTNTVIHEYVHHTQTNRTFNRQYDQYTEEYGYWENPFEVESRTISDKYQRQCVRDLVRSFDLLK